MHWGNLETFGRALRRHSGGIRDSRIGRHWVGRDIYGEASGRLGDSREVIARALEHSGIGAFGHLGIQALDLSRLRILMRIRTVLIRIGTPYAYKDSPFV